MRASTTPRWKLNKIVRTSTRTHTHTHTHTHHKWKKCIITGEAGKIFWFFAGTKKKSGDRSTMLGKNWSKADLSRHRKSNRTRSRPIQQNEGSQDQRSTTPTSAFLAEQGPGRHQGSKPAGHSAPDRHRPTHRAVPSHSWHKSSQILGKQHVVWCRHRHPRRSRISRKPDRTKDRLLV